MNDSIPKSIRALSGSIALEQIADLEIRRCLQAALFRIQWMLDNWPKDSVPLQFKFSVQNYAGVVQLVGDELPQRKRRYYGTNEFSKLGFHDLPEAVDYDMSVVVSSRGIVTLKNDEKTPDFGQYYAVGINDEKGWQFPREHPFRFQQTDSNGGDITAGLARLNGANLTITGLPTSISTLTASTRYWIALDTENATAEWLSGAVEAYPTFPVGSDSIMIFPILTITCAGAVGAEVITAIRQERWIDIVVGASGGETDPDPVDPGSTYVDIMSRDGNDPPTGPGDSTALVNTWAAGGANGLHKWWNAGTVWDGYAATPVLYYMARRDIITNKGKVFGVGAETRITIDTPVNHADL